MTALMTVGIQVFLCGVVVTTLSLLLGYGYGRYVLGLHPVFLLGALTGALTSTAALGIVTKATRSSLPTFGYAGTYAFANILLTLAGYVMMRIQF